MTGPACSICAHAQSDSINAWLASGRTVASTARHFAVSNDALWRHKKGGHYQPPEEEKATSAEPTMSSPLGFATAMRAQDAAEYMKARNRGDWRTMATMSREARLANMDVAALQGDIATGTTVNVAVGVQSDNLQIAIQILAALTPYPAAKEAVLRVLTGSGVMQIEGSPEPLAIEGAEGV